MTSPTVGDRLGGRYQLLQQRASGATATVWEARDDLLGRVVAVKILHPHLAADELGRRFAEEARTSATVTHPGLVAVYDTLSDPVPAIVLEWVDGGDLRSRLDAGPADPIWVTTIGAGIADALAALHARGLVHRDVKPANVLLTRDGRPKLGDFGIATTNPGDRTATGVVLGTAKYLSPEQVRGERLDGRTDVYALCAVLYEALTGRPPFERDGDLPTAIARLEEDAPAPGTLRSGIPPDLETVVQRGLARDPDGRWRTAHDLRDALHAVATGEAIPATAPPAMDTPAAGQRRTPTTLDPTAAGTMALPVATAAPEAPPPAPPPTVKVRRRRWPLLLLLLLLGIVGGFGFTLLEADGGIRGLFDGDDPPVAVAAAAFDPEGSGTPGENDELAMNVLDGDPGTAWLTERYEQRDLGTKPGVGLVIELADPATVETVTVHTPDSRGWAATVHVTDRPGPDLASFGEPDATGTGLGPVAELRPGSAGTHVLVWFTHLGDGPEPIRLVVTEVEVA